MSWFRHRPIPHEPSKLVPVPPSPGAELPTPATEIKPPIKYNKKK